MGHFRRIFTAPGNLRIWFSLVIYISALVALLVYRERIGQTVSRAFQEVTEVPPAKPPKAPRQDREATAARKAAALAPGERETRLLALARAGNRTALAALEKLVEKRPAATRISDNLRLAATAALDEPPRALRAVAAGLLLWAEHVPPKPKAANGAVKQLGGKRPAGVRLGALRRLGLLGLRGVRTRPGERAVLRALSERSARARAAAARAAGRLGIAAGLGPLFKLVSAKEQAPVRQAALAGLVDLGLAGVRLRSEVMRQLAARLADQGLPSKVAEEIWRTLRRLAGSSTPPQLRKKTR